MYYVYLIFSLKIKQIYIGYSADLRERLKEHNSNRVEATQSKGPWKLIYYEAYLSEKDARQREIKLKHHGKGIQELKKRLENSFNNLR